jgi:hypothetical protein
MLGVPSLPTILAIIAKRYLYVALSSYVGVDFMHVTAGMSTVGTGKFFHLNASKNLVR